MELSTIRIAWRNLGRSRRRTLLAVSAIAVGQFALLATNGIMHGYTDNIRNALTGPMIGHVQVHAPKWREERAMDLAIDDADAVVAAIRTDPQVRNVGARIYAPVLVAPKRDAFTAVVVGLDLEAESQDYGLLSGLKEKLGEREIFIGYRLAERMQAKVGQEVAIVGQGADGSIANDLYTIKDIIKCPSDLVNQSGIVMALVDAQALLVMDNQVHEIVIRAKQSGQATAMAKRLGGEAQFASLEVLPWEDVVPEFVQILSMSDYVGYIILILVFIAAIAGIANTLMMSTFERMHEFGMLLALGSRPGRLVRMILVEAVLLGLVGVIAGTAMGYAFIWISNACGGIDMASWAADGKMADLAYKGLKLPLHVFPRLEPGDTLIGLTAVVFTSLIAAIWPASIASRLEPMEAMRA